MSRTIALGWKKLSISHVRSLRQGVCFDRLEAENKAYRTQLEVVNSAIAPGWKKHRTWLEGTSDPVGRNIALGWKAVAPGWKEHRTRLEETSHLVGNFSMLNLVLSTTSELL